MIFKTKRLLVRELIFSDLDAFHKLQSNPKVMQFVNGKTTTKKENAKDLKNLIAKYADTKNNFWIYAIIRQSDQQFVGTCALVKDNNDDDEIGYRFLEEFWGMGYGFEVCQGLLAYCKSILIKKIVAYVVDDNIASSKIIKKCGFTEVSKSIEAILKLPETKFELNLIHKLT